uniref:Uncharacterized protein n=1 Tax=Rhizophora mucronata TaxID=61149 RepID=A0A2P2IJB4_RHIMU
MPKISWNRKSWDALRYVSHQGNRRWMKNFYKSCTQNKCCKGTQSTKEPEVLPRFSQMFHDQKNCKNARSHHKRRP